MILMFSIFAIPSFIFLFLLFGCLIKERGIISDTYRVEDWFTFKKAKENITVGNIVAAALLSIVPIVNLIICVLFVLYLAAWAISTISTSKVMNKKPFAKKETK